MIDYSILLLLLHKVFSCFKKIFSLAENTIFEIFFTGWVDDSVFIRRNPDSNSEEVWSNGAGQQAGAFTTGRQGRGGGRSNAPPPPPPAVKPRSQVCLFCNFACKVPEYDNLKYSPTKINQQLWYVIVKRFLKAFSC